MAGRIVATDQGRETIQQMQATIGGDITAAFTKLRNQANTLQDKNVWDGPHADEFRNTVWPQVQNSLNSFSGDLDQLRSAIDKVLAEITRAGGG